MKEYPKCRQCGENCIPDGLTSGYGEFNGEKYCFACCALRDREAMLKDNFAYLYCGEKEITNWPGSLRFPIIRKETAKNGTTTYYFTFNNHTWFGKCGKWNQCAKFKAKKYG